MSYMWLDQATAAITRYLRAAGWLLDDLHKRPRNEQEVDELTWAWRVLVIEWLTTNHESDPAWVEAPPALYPAPGIEDVVMEWPRLVLAEPDEAAKHPDLPAVVEWRQRRNQVRQQQAARQTVGRFLRKLDERMMRAEWGRGCIPWRDAVRQAWAAVNTAVQAGAVSNTPASTKGKGSTAGKRGGPRFKYDAQADARLAGDYRAAGMSIKDFAQTRKMPYVAVKKALDRHRKRRN
ncbi:MAG: hypothetical protein WD042_03475 [Phycisphaeraceae bacterium]